MLFSIQIQKKVNEKGEVGGCMMGCGVNNKWRLMEEREGEG